MNTRANVFEMTRHVVGAKLRWRPPLYLVHAVTARCNAHCGSCAWKPDFYNPSDQLSTDAIKQTPFAELLKRARLRHLAGNEGEHCHKYVSIHRVEISEVWNGNLEPLWSWRMLRKPPSAPPRQAQQPIQDIGRTKRITSQGL